MSISDLLAHPSGLPPYMEEPWTLGRPRGIWEVVARLAASAVPTVQAVYSCLGFVVLKHWAEAVSPEPFEVLVGRAAPGLMYNPPEPDRQRAAPTGPAPTWRGGDEWIQGQVHDPIAWLLRQWQRRPFRRPGIGNFGGAAGLAGSSDLEETGQRVRAGPGLGLSPPVFVPLWVHGLCRLDPRGNGSVRRSSDQPCPRGGRPPRLH